MTGIFILLAFVVGLVAAVGLWLARGGEPDRDGGVHPEQVHETPPTRER